MYPLEQSILSVSIIGTFLLKWRIICPAHPLLRHFSAVCAFVLECLIKK